MVDDQNVQEMSFEAKKWEDEKNLRDREIKLKEDELKAKMADQRMARWFNPLAAALVAAILAGGANVLVARQTGHDQTSLESTKENHENQLEKIKAERARVVAVIQGVSPDLASANLQLLLDTKLVTDPELVDGIVAYRKSRLGGQGAGGEPAANNPPAAPVTDVYETDWLGGGHSQNEACQQGMKVLQSKYPGKTLTVIHSDEVSRSDFLRHVQYKYRCTYRVS